MTEICSFFQMKSLKLDMHFTLTVHLNEDLPHFRGSTATTCHGYHIEQHKSTESRAPNPEI